MIGRNIINALLVTSVLSCCVNRWTEGEKELYGNTDSLAYRVSPLMIEENGVQVEAFLEDDLAKGSLTLFMKIKNDAETKIIIDLTNCSLLIDADRVAVPQVTTPYETEILPGKQQEYRIQYDPINSVDFFFRTGYRGDMKQQYSLNLNFILDQAGSPLLTKSFTFKMDEVTYSAYLQNSALEHSTQIYDFAFNSETYADEEEKYLTNVFSATKEDFSDKVFAITPAITINKVIANILTFRKGDTVTINMRLLNQDLHNLKIEPEKAIVISEGRNFNAVSLYSDSFDNGKLPGSYIFKPGTRLHMLLKYYVPGKIDRWQLSNDWIMVNSNDPKEKNAWVKLLYRDLSFEESSITKDIL
jgi:hypothetical protein